MNNPTASRRFEFLPSLLICFVLAGCGRPQVEDTGDWHVERERVDGVEVVRTLSGSVWQEPASLVEELAIGVLEGEQEYMFGRIDQVAPDGRGGVYVFDGQVPALRHYDAEGRYMRTLGGQGSGPGEYRDATLGLAVLADGRVLLRDPRNNRFNVYGPDGTPVDHWPLASGLFTSRATSERAEREAQRAHLIRTQGRFLTAQPPPVPASKPFFRGIWQPAGGSSTRPIS